jgi:chorismate mutase
MEPLSELRASLDTLDNALFSILAERFRVTHQVGIYKRSHALPAIDPKREQAQFARAEEQADTLGLNPDLAKRVLRTIIDQVVVDHEALQRAYIQNPENSGNN